ncbi:ATP-binding cassette domain-containing protein [Cohnella sp. WQ 127256]|uniref:ATP-binding cassette domain-containing protein n=1 Tax=Cohnella sp. WQ 127256 TaxID=2938790 RepID=UPI002117D424|nr:ATP-binding cassette domain-containing protein [Cohnella sp. WQ 127256]
MIHLKLDDVTYKYPHEGARTVRIADLTLTPGLYYLYGANGSGKTMLLKGLAGLLTPAKGIVKLHRGNQALDVAQYKWHMGYCPQEYALLESLTVYAYLKYIAKMRFIPNQLIPSRIDELLDTFQLKSMARQKIDSLSIGQKKRILLLQALLADPDLLLLDEPLAHTDLHEYNMLSRLLASEEGERIIIASDHPISRQMDISCRILFISEGQLKGPYDSEQLKASLDNRIVTCRIPTTRWREQLEKMSRVCSILSLKHGPEEVIFRVYLHAGKTSGSVPFLANVEITTMEDVYLCFQIPSVRDNMLR